MEWQDYLQLAAVRKDEESALAEYRRKSVLKRIILALKGYMPRLTGSIPAEGLALRYVQEIGSYGDINKLIHLDDGQTISLYVRYDCDTLLPFVSITFYDGNTAFQENRQFIEHQGEYEDFFYSEERPIGYPLSEIGVTGLPDKMPEEANAIKKRFEAVTLEIAMVLKELAKQDRFKEVIKKLRYIRQF